MGKVRITEATRQKIRIGEHFELVHFELVSFDYISFRNSDSVYILKSVFTLSRTFIY